MKNTENIEKTNRKTYRKPKLEKVQLVSEEAVLEGCKTSLSVDPFPRPCKPGTTSCARGRARS
jgi:hypothetical protein